MKKVMTEEKEIRTIVNNEWHCKKVNGLECFFSKNGEYRVSPGVDNEWIGCKL